jgi:hypothetical protein
MTSFRVEHVAGGVAVAAVARKRQRGRKRRRWEDERGMKKERMATG